MFHGRDPYDIASFERYYGVHQVEAFSKGGSRSTVPSTCGWRCSSGCSPSRWPRPYGSSPIWPVSAPSPSSWPGPSIAVSAGRPLSPSRPSWCSLGPGRATLETGQATVLYALLTYVAWSQVRRRPWLAAVALACAMGKPPFGLPLLALILARRLWPVALRGVAIFVAASLPVVIWLSIERRLVGVGVARHRPQPPVHRPQPPGCPGVVRTHRRLSLIARYAHGHLGGAAEVRCVRGRGRCGGARHRPCRTSGRGGRCGRRWCCCWAWPPCCRWPTSTTTCSCWPGPSPPSCTGLCSRARSDGGVGQSRDDPWPRADGTGRARGPSYWP